MQKSLHFAYNRLLFYEPIFQSGTKGISFFIFSFFIYPPSHLVKVPKQHFLSRVVPFFPCIQIIIIITTVGTLFCRDRIIRFEAPITLARDRFDAGLKPGRRFCSFKPLRLLFFLRPRVTTHFISLSLSLDGFLSHQFDY